MVKFRGEKKHHSSQKWFYEPANIGTYHDFHVSCGRFSVRSFPVDCMNKYSLFISGQFRSFRATWYSVSGTHKSTIEMGMRNRNSALQSKTEKCSKQSIFEVHCELIFIVANWLLGYCDISAQKF